MYLVPVIFNYYSFIYSNKCEPLGIKFVLSYFILMLFSVRSLCAYVHIVGHLSSHIQSYTLRTCTGHRCYCCLAHSIDNSMDTLGKTTSIVKLIT